MVSTHSAGKRGMDGARKLIAKQEMLYEKFDKQQPDALAKQHMVHRATGDPMRVTFSKETP
jgi:hypothetical protein